MAQSEKPLMSDQSILPPHLVLLGRVLRPIALEVQKRIAKVPFQIFTTTYARFVKDV